MSEEKSIIKYDDFDKLDIKIGTVIECEKVENSQKLLKLIVDFGEFKRQIIAGIATKYNPEDLINKQLPIIVNLAPRKLLGLESQGMILAIGDNDVEALLTPTEEVNNGAGVH
ncbi:MAG: methionine--tRNA ligase subunit beta [Candidatus ainarchaeum sp.]|nr:methionine--tRNA ligase subunit beta [Candidatus ainarchaeum sp.]